MLTCTREVRCINESLDKMHLANKLWQIFGSRGLKILISTVFIVDFVILIYQCVS